MAKKKNKKDAKALNEFLAEAQEIAESLGKNLMLLDNAIKEGDLDPELVNEVFRGMHTLKSLSGTFGVDPLSRIAHYEENLLDQLRLGRIELTPSVLDLLFESVDLVTRILSQVSDVGDNQAADGLPEVEKLLEKLHRLGEKQSENASPTGPPSEAAAPQPELLLESEVFEVLTEYEEHRLRTNIDRGVALYKIHTKFGLESIDEDLDKIKSKLKPLGEIITYLPSAEEGEPDRLEIQIIFALQKNPLDLEEAVDGMDVELERIEAKRQPRSVMSDPPEHIPSADPEDPLAEEIARHTKSAPAALAEPEAEGSRALSLRSVSQTVRVDIRKLDTLMNVVGELAVICSAIARVSEDIRTVLGRRDLTLELHRINRGFERRLAELREGILEVRMVPLTQMLDRLNRMIRKISRDLEKEVNFIVSGAETEVDKLIIEEMSNPMMHIIRNAIDHGIESPQERRAANKPDVGTVALTAYQKGNHVMIEIEDDGKGIDVERIIEVATRRELISEEQARTMTDQEITELIFLPGMSTATETTEISGRGVGMDVVKTHIGTIGGVVEVQSDPGIGTKFMITLPVTLAIIPALLVSIADRVYAVPINTVAEALYIQPENVHQVMGTEAITFRGKTLFLCRLDEFFGFSRGDDKPEDSCVVVASYGHRRLGLVVDGIIGQQDVVIKPLGKSLSRVEVFSGVTDIGDQRLALVLDTARIIEQSQVAKDRVERRVAPVE